MNEQQPWTDMELEQRRDAWKKRETPAGAYRAFADMTELRNAWQADHDALTAKLNAANARITELERNGHIPMRDTVGGVITSEWATPEEDAAWAHLEADDD